MAGLLIDHGGDGFPRFALLAGDADQDRSQFLAEGGSGWVANPQHGALADGSVTSPARIIAADTVESTGHPGRL
jgi:hypothetical protein